MLKLLSLLLILAMGLHVLRPFGVPGLRRRGDAWKIALGAILILGVSALLKHL